MNDTSKFTRPDLMKFFVLTFFISWTLWSPLYFLEQPHDFWVLPGAWGPTIAALILAYLKAGKKGLKDLLGKLLIWKVPFKYYLFAIFGIFLVGLLSILIYLLFEGQIPHSSVILEGMGLEEGDLGLALALFPVFFLANTLLGGPIAEELGWRGYAQERMQTRYSPNRTGLAIGFLWSLWHLPLFFVLPKAVGFVPFWAYIPLMMAMGVIFSWLFNKTNGSVLLAILLHGGFNFAHGFVGASVFKDLKLLSIQVTLIILLALVLSRRNKKPFVRKLPTS